MAALLLDVAALTVVLACALALGMALVRASSPVVATRPDIGQGELWEMRVAPSVLVRCPSGVCDESDLCWSTRALAVCGGTNWRGAALAYAIVREVKGELCALRATMARAAGCCVRLSKLQCLGSTAPCVAPVSADCDSFGCCSAT